MAKKKTFENIISNLLGEPVSNLCHAFYDQYVEANVKFRSRAGMKEVIIRRQLGKCCKWCADLAGIYTPENAPADIYKRHDNCKCMVTYKDEDGYTDAWSKREFKTQKEARKVRESELLNSSKSGQSTAQNEAVEKIAQGIGATDKRAELEKKQLKKKELVSRAKRRDITKSFLQDATPGQGFFEIETGFNEEERPDELRIARIIHRELGGDIIVKEEVQGQKNPDYNWLGMLWDLKTTTTAKAANSAIRSGLKQIKKNPGGIILDYGSIKVEMDDILSVVEERMQWHPDDSADIIIVFNEKIKKVLRY